MLNTFVVLLGLKVRLAGSQTLSVLPCSFFSYFPCGFCLFTYLCHRWGSLTCCCTSRVHGWYDRARGLWFPCHCCETPFRWWNCGAAVSAAHGGMLVSLWLSARLRRILTDERSCKCASLTQAHTSSHWKTIVIVHVCVCVHVCVLGFHTGY